MPSPTTSLDTVAARDLAFRYGERVALAGVSFAVQPGSRYAFLGPNGSGKSTLFKLLATILPVQKGELTVLGRDLRREATALRAQLGVVFQSPAVDRKLTVRQNLDYGGRMFGLAGVALRARIEAMLERTGLRERADDKVEQLSGGLRRRVELGKCLLHEPRILLLDEPTTGLDPTARRELWALLRSIPDLTVLFTTHLLDEAEHADRVLILHEGKVVAEGPPAELARGVGGLALEVGVDQEHVESTRTLLRERFTLIATDIDGGLRAQAAEAHRLVPAVVDALGNKLRRVAVSPPSLLDVFFAKTGAAFDVTPPPPPRGRRRGGRS